MSWIMSMLLCLLLTQNTFAIYQARCLCITVSFSVSALNPFAFVRLKPLLHFLPFLPSLPPDCLISFSFLSPKDIFDITNGRLNP